MDITPYNAETDREACLRVWEEVGWLDRSDKKRDEAVEKLFGAGRALVSKIDGEAECLVLAAGGSLRYLDEDISFSGVTGVTTGRVARRQGIAGRLTARLIAEEADDGAAISGLGMFEQGFYDRLGMGTGIYERKVRFDPQLLKVAFAGRPPKRLSMEDWEALHACRLARKREHGYVSFNSPLITQAQGNETGQQFGLGFYDGPKGELTHFAWFRTKGGEHGPYYVPCMAYQSAEQFLELMGVIKSLGEQVRVVEMMEPPGIQLQDLLEQPLQNMMITHRGGFQTGSSSLAYWQIRICDVEECLSKTKLRRDTLRFNLQLEDPIEKYLDGSTGWKGVGGDYVVEAGKTSGAERGTDASLPTLKTTVNAFSRLWLGIRPATGLAVTDTLEGPRDLLEALDDTFRLPSPARDWDF